MTRTMRGCLAAQLQPVIMAEPENSTSVLQLEEQADAKEGKVIEDNIPVIDYKPEGPDPNDERVAQE